MKKNKEKISNQPCAKLRCQATASSILGHKLGQPMKTLSPKISPRWRKHYAQLLSLRDRIVKEKEDLAKDAIEETPTYSMNMADAATDEFDRDLALGKLSAEQDALNEIEQAIRRIHNGTYGVCELTGKPIPLSRLNAIPWTRFAARAEAQLERQGEVSRTHLGALGSVHESATVSLEESEISEESQPSAKDEELWSIYSPPVSQARQNRK